MPVEIRLWHCCITGGPYMDPRVRGMSVSGFAYGHPEKADGTPVTTSRVVSANGREIRTASGSTYVLGEPDPHYIAWCAENGKSFDPENPIRAVLL